MLTRAIPAAVAVVLVACSSTPPPDDAGVDARAGDASIADDARGDAPSAVDGSVDDAATDDASVDDASTDDASIDDAATDDASVDDAAITVDAGGDAGVGPDASTSDAGTDAGSADSGTDAGPRDAGLDAGGTTCAISVTPPSGSETDSFDVAIASNGSACQVRLDGGATLSIPCTGMMSQPGSFFGTGMHTLELLVGAGPSGPVTCSASFTVTAGPDGGTPDGGSTTTCAISITPPSAPSSGTFDASWSSNGAGCTITIDAGAPMSVPCTFMIGSLPASMFGVGTHTVVLDVASGPSGATSCSTMATVTP